MFEVGATDSAPGGNIVTTRRPGAPRRGAATLAVLALLGGSVVATEVLTTDEEAAAQFATGGSGAYGGLIDWITWGLSPRTLSRLLKGTLTPSR